MKRQTDNLTNGMDEWTNRQQIIPEGILSKTLYYIRISTESPECVCWMSCECLLQAGGGLKVTKRVRPRGSGAVGRVPLPQPGFPPVSLPAQTGRHMITRRHTGHLISQDIYIIC